MKNGNTAMSEVTAQLAEQFAESARLEWKIRANLEGLGYVPGNN